jgi:urease accessory protein
MSAVKFPPSNPAGHGTVYLSSNPAQFRTLTYAYPLKLISPSPLTHEARIIHTLFLLTYGGGLVAGDTVTLSVTLEPHTRLIVLTQGSTKIFKTPDPAILSSQRMTIHLGEGCALCYLPDPVQPFKDSAFEQSQLYFLDGTDASLCVCDWLSSGRTARGENWDFWRYGSRNEVWDREDNRRRRLLLRDNLLLDRRDGTGLGALVDRVDEHGVFGTLIIRGPVFDQLASFFLSEFEKMSRIGAKRWEDDEEPIVDPNSLEGKRAIREKQEKSDRLLWTAARIRGFVMVKFGAREVEGAKRWLRTMIRDEGSIERDFGERSTLCLK